MFFVLSFIIPSFFFFSTDRILSLQLVFLLVRWSIEFVFNFTIHSFYLVLVSLITYFSLEVMKNLVAL